jgi:hypothetical protein
MQRAKLLIPAVVTFAIAAIPAFAADKGADSAFKWTCISSSTQTLPKGNAGAGKIEFTVEVDPAAQNVTIDGKKHSAKIDKAEVAFGLNEDAVVSISRSRKRFGVIAPIMGVARDDSRKYLYYQGECKAA